MADPAQDESTVDIALRYAGCGLRVLPIKPGTKRPPMREWVEAATDDPAIIRNWFTGIYKEHGVGLAMGHQPDGRFIFALDVDEHDPAHSGIESLADLEGTQGSLPETWRSITGSSGLHLLFTSDVDIRNGIAGDGLDIRGEGGQIVVYPSTHPLTHRRYEWEDTYAPWERDVAEAPAWLVELAARPSVPAPEPQPPVSGSTLFDDPDSPAEWLRSKWDWSLQLRDAGWSEHHAARNGDVHWTRPGKDVREGESAVLHPGGPFVVFSTDATMTGLHAVGRVNSDGSVSVSPIQFYAAQRHGGNLSAAARAIHRMMEPDSHLSAPGEAEQPLSRYLAQELVWPDFWTGEHAGEGWLAEPVIAAGRLTVLYAPAKQGKSEILLAIVAELATGRPILGQANPQGPRHVIYLDYEMTEADLAERLGQLGYGDTDDLSHLHYFSLPSLPPLDTAEGAAVTRELARHFGAELVAIDTLGRAVEGDENSNDTYRNFARHTGLSLKAEGVAVVRTDHAGKDREKGQRGASAKNDDADVVLRVDRVDTGWKLTRTHTRVGWVPESVLIDRTVRVSDDTLRIELASTSKPTYPEGTGKYVAELRAVGLAITPATGERDFKRMIAASPVETKRDTFMRAALRWWKAELGPTPIDEPVDSRLSPEPDEEPTLGDVR